jgi:hypothetical protein
MIISYIQSVLPFFTSSTRPTPSWQSNEKIMISRLNLKHAQLRKMRIRRTITLISISGFIVGLLGILGMDAFLDLACRPFLTWFLSSLAITSIVIATAVSSTQQRPLCPRCGKTFFERKNESTHYVNYFSSKCLHCSLKINESFPEEEASSLE